MSTRAHFDTVGDLPPEVTAALLQFGLALADTKQMIGRRFSEWVTAAPTMEAAVAAAAITQDELGHARSLFAMLRDFPGAPPELQGEGEFQRQDNFAPGRLHAPLPSWFDCIALLFLLDRALTAVFKLAKQSSFTPLRQRVAKILQEEHFHEMYSRGWLKHIQKQGEASLSRLQESITAFWPAAVYWFGPEEDESTTALIDAGILAADIQRAYQEWFDKTQSLLQQNGLRVPDFSPAWQTWDPRRREAAV